MTNELQIVARSNDSLQHRIEQLICQLESQQQAAETTISAAQAKYEQALDETLRERQAHLDTKRELSQMKAHCEEMTKRLTHEQTNAKMMKMGLESNAIVVG